MVRTNAASRLATPVVVEARIRVTTTTTTTNWTATSLDNNNNNNKNNNNNNNNTGLQPLLTTTTTTTNHNSWGGGSNSGNKPPSNNGGCNNCGSNQGSNSNNNPPSNSGNNGWGGGSNSGNNNNNASNSGGFNHGSNNNASNKPPSNNGGGCNNYGGSNQGTKPPSNNGQGGGSNQGNRPPSNSGNNGCGGGSNSGNKPPSNSGGNNNNYNKPPSDSGGNRNNGGSNQGNNRPPSSNGDWGGVGPTQDNNGGWPSGSNQGNKPPSNSGGYNNGGSNQGNNSNRPTSTKPPSNNGDCNQGNNGNWTSGSNHGNNHNTKPPSNSGGSNHGGNNNKPPRNNGGSGGSNQGNKPPSNNGDCDTSGQTQGIYGGWGSGSNSGNNNNNNVGWATGSNQGNNNYTKPPSNAGSARGSNYGRPPSNNGGGHTEKEGMGMGMGVDMGWNTGGSDNNWRPPSVAGSVRSDKQPGDGWKSGPASGEKWSVAQQQNSPDCYKPPSNSGWVPKDNVPPHGNKPPTPSNNNAPHPPRTPSGWVYGSPSESERMRTAEKVEGWKGSIKPPKGGWPAVPVTFKDSPRLRENAPDDDNNTRARGRSPATARSSASASGKDWKQGLTRVEEEPDNDNNGYDMWKKPSSNKNGNPGRNAGHKSAGILKNNNKPSGEQYGWNSGPDAAPAGTGWDRGSDRVSTPSFKAPEKDEWTAGGMRREDKPRNNKPPSNNGDWTPGLGAAAGWKADCTKPPSNTGWAAGSNQGNHNNKPSSNAGSARGSQHGKPSSDNGGWGDYGQITGDYNKAPGSGTGSNPFKDGLPPWAANCTDPWDGTKPANNNKPGKGDDQNALNIHTVTDLPGYNRDLAPPIGLSGLSGFPPVVGHYHEPVPVKPVPVKPKTPGPPPGGYPSTPYENTPHPPGYLPNTQAHMTILPLYNNHPVPHHAQQYPSHNDTAPWNTWDRDMDATTKPAVITTKPPGGCPSYEPGQRSAQFSKKPILSEEDLQSLYRQVIFSAMSSRQPLPQPKPDREFSLRDCWVLIALHDQYDRASASKEKWFDLQARFAQATGGRMVDPRVLRAKVKQGEKEAKVVEGWGDDEVGGMYKRSLK
ncbi:unnamed protein product [Sordaria macrospora k-hell]|uniref:WGS project CABT00000000 data, contig 2.11 n=1 Tax=Sordaria macrospora (strain ATCC MYA-333 / DSM 997 / K(L3346) / K-hell) TaxID=771870 RepID=F7VX62_SORMK|nr:uncharacterized protein SMAC_02682 [Sordaria macrospora k-hell]CCC10103.1 unnamed protein product [Sordaria macrospora k-hell]